MIKRSKHFVINSLIILILLFLISCSTTKHLVKEVKDNYKSKIQRLIDTVAPEDIWYVMAGAGANGDGKSVANPIGLSAIIESKSKQGDTIVLLHSDIALTGGLKLKAGQSLIGLSDTRQKPIITNKDAIRNNGCGIVLANNNRILNVLIKETYASGIYGNNISTAHIEGVKIYGANQSKSFLEVKYATLPGSVPHGGMVFVHSEMPAQVIVTSSEIMQSAGFGVVSITSNSVSSSLSVKHTRVNGGSKIGFFDVGIAAMVQGSASRVHLDVYDSEVQGRLSRSGRNIMVVASGGAKAKTHVERFLSGPTGQDGIVMAVMQSPSEIDLYIGDSMIEGAGQMNIEGTLVNLPPDDPLQADKGSVSIEIEGSTIRNAGQVNGFEDVAANIWLGASRFLEDSLPTLGRYTLRIRNSRIVGAGRSGLEFGDLGFLTNGLAEKSDYDIVLRDNIIIDNGEAEVMIYAPNAQIDARRNCWGLPEGLEENKVVTSIPAKVEQLDATEPLPCHEAMNTDIHD